MDVNSIIDHARTLSYTNSAQFSNSDALPFLNVVYQEAISDVVAINSLYLTQTVFFDTVVQQNEYDFTDPTTTVDADTVRKILSVSVKYKNPDYEGFQANQEYSKGEKIYENGFVYIAKADFTAGAVFDVNDRTKIYEGYTNAAALTYGEYATSDLNNPLSTDGEFPFPFDEHRSRTNPVYFFQNNQIKIYPFPEEVVKEGIKIQATRFAKDLVVGGAESTIEIERPYHQTLVRGLVYYIFQSQGKLNEANDALAKYTDERQKMKNNMRARNPYGQRMITPNLSHLT